MKRNSVSKTLEANGGHSNLRESERGTNRLSGPDRRTQLLSIATTEFAKTGLHGTTTQTLAKAAEISEPVLYDHFRSKNRLFRATVEANIEKRLQMLDARLAAISCQDTVDCIAQMAEATVTIYAAGPGSAVLMNWALLEAPEYATDLYRDETGSVKSLWDREVTQRFPASPSRTALSIHIVPHIVGVSLAYGFWLSSLRHSEESATLLAKQYARGAAGAAVAFLDGGCQQ